MSHFPECSVFEHLWNNFYKFSSPHFVSKLVKRGLERVLERRRKEDSGGGGYRVCVLTPNCAAFSSALLGIWSCALPVAAVPLCKAHPEKTLEYYVTDSEASVILTTRDYADKASLNVKLHKIGFLMKPQKGFLRKPHLQNHSFRKHHLGYLRKPLLAKIFSRNFITQ